MYTPEQIDVLELLINLIKEHEGRLEQLVMRLEEDVNAGCSARHVSG